MQVSYDTEACTTYITMAEGSVARTVDLTDVIAVDLDATGRPLGVELLVLPHNISDEMIEDIVEAFPLLEPLSKVGAWRPVFA